MNSSYDSRGFLRRNRWLLAIGTLILTFLVTMYFVTKRVTVEAGEEIVLVDKPFWTIFGNGGLRPEPVSSGSKWLFYTTEIIPYDLRPRQVTEAFHGAADGAITSDNIPVDFNTYIKVRVVTGKTPQLHSSFGPTWYAQNLKEVFRTSVRDHVSRTPMVPLTTRQTGKDGKDILAEIQRTVQEDVRKFVKDKGLQIEVMEVIIGKATPPQKTLDAQVETGIQDQRANTEMSRKAAEIQRKDAETKRAEADNAYRNGMGLNPDQFMQLEIAKRQVEAVKECGAKANCTIIIGQLGSTHPTIPMK